MPLCILNDMETLKVTLNVNEGDTPYLALGQDVSIRFDAFPNEVVHVKITRIMPYVNTTTRTSPYRLAMAAFRALTSASLVAM